MKTVNTTKIVQMFQHIYDMLETADDPDDVQEVQRAVHSYLEDLQPNTPIRTTKAGEEEEASILGELPELPDLTNQPEESVMDSPETNELLGELTPTNTENLYTEGDIQKHFGEEQAEGLDNLLEGLRDTPHDNRW